MPNPERRRWTRRYLPDSLLGRIVVVMALGVVSAQLVGTLLWARQLRESARTEALGAAHHLAVNAAGTLRFFRDLYENERLKILVELDAIPAESNERINQGLERRLFDWLAREGRLPDLILMIDRLIGERDERDA